MDISVLTARSGGGLGTAVLGIVLAVGTGVYLAALWRPPPARLRFAAIGAVLAAGCTVPHLFSADVFAYAFYGDLLLHGLNPYGHDPAALHDALSRAAVVAWDGRIPPRCVYGPLAVALAALADVAGAPFGATGAIAAQRFGAAAAYAGVVAAAQRLYPDERSRTALTLHPVVLWSVAEGHNDAAMLALALGSLVVAPSAPQFRAVMTALAVLVKAPAVLLFAWLRGAPGAGLALALAAVGYVPLAIAFLGAGPAPAGASAPEWQSPLGVFAALIGRPAAAVAALAMLGAALTAAPRMSPRERLPALAFAGWLALPNAYPWYALWIVPIAAYDLRSVWSQTLIVAAIFAPARAAVDVIFPDAGTLHGEMIALATLPPLVFRMLARGSQAAAAVTLVAVALVLPVAAQAQTAPAPQASPSAGSALPPPPTPPAPTPETPAPEATPSPAPAPTVAPTPNPYLYVITPPPTAGPADGPHILEVDVNDHAIHPGGPLLVRVTTSANVIGVEARAFGRFIAIPANGPGVFTLAYTMPSGIPFWLMNKNYDIVIAAATPDGRQTTVTVTMALTNR